MRQRRPRPSEDVQRQQRQGEPRTQPRHQQPAQGLCASTSSGTNSTVVADMLPAWRRRLRSAGSRPGGQVQRLLDRGDDLGTHRMADRARGRRVARIGLHPRRGMRQMTGAKPGLGRWRTTPSPMSASTGQSVMRSLSGHLCWRSRPSLGPPPGAAATTAAAAASPNSAVAAVSGLSRWSRRTGSVQLSTATIRSRAPGQAAAMPLPAPVQRHDRIAGIDPGIVEHRQQAAKAGVAMRKQGARPLDHARLAKNVGRQGRAQPDQANVSQTVACHPKRPCPAVAGSTAAGRARLSQRVGTGVSPR